MAQQSPEAAGQSAVARRIGAIKAINGASITLTPDSGGDVAVTVAPNARLLRLAPGEKDLKSTTPIQLQDLQPGDTIRVRGYASADAKAFNALEVIVITRTALSSVSNQIRQDWQKRGTGGIVRAVDPATGTVTISISGFAGARSVAVHTTRSTIVRRYAPDSVKFEDARPGTLEDIHLGDQLRARGDRNPDRTELNAEEIVSGRFPYVEGTINSIDTGASTINVQDVLSKKPVVVKVTADSQLRQLTAEIAQLMAMRLKGTGTAGEKASDSSGSAASMHPEAATTRPAANAAPGGRSGGAPDLQQMLYRLPAATLADLHQGDAVLIVATEGNTAINLYSGVDPILRAAPSGSEAMILGAWSLGAPSGDNGN